MENKQKRLARLSGLLRRQQGRKKTRRTRKWNVKMERKMKKTKVAQFFREKSRIMCTCGVVRTVHAFNLAHVAVQVYSMFVTL